MSFDTIKIALTNHAILIFPDSEEPYVFFTDASKHSWSGYLWQERIMNINDKDLKSFIPTTSVIGTFVVFQRN